MNLMLPKGTRDFLPEEMILRNQIINTIKNVFEEYGFSPIETPVFERMDVLGAKFAAGEESDALKETFRVKDQGERELGLRFDLTVPFSRVIGMNPKLKMPFKRYQIQKVYRDGPVTQNRYREFLQCDVDVVGVNSVLADAEILAVAKKVFEKLNLKVKLFVNNRKLLNELMNYLKIPETKKENVLIAIDKLDKLSVKEVEKELREKGLTEKQIDSLMQLISINGNNEEKINYLKEKIGNTEGIQELEKIISYCKEFKTKIEFNAGLVRGLAYYTGPIFEVQLNEGNIKGSVAGGGRYDKMISQFLNQETEIPATGISFGIERIYDLIKEKESNPKKTITELYIISAGVSAVNLVQEFREKDIKTDFDLIGKGISKNLDYANKKEIPFVIILGENEVKAKKFNLKNMKTGKETEIKLSELNKAVELIKN
ncbi:MAG: histidine--tRNA ligase [Candidatus Diapherotrites archaeon]|nr:histidine--tRNA ligase [Candidatus Diapherotrites archaeon]